MMRNYISQTDNNFHNQIPSHSINLRRPNVTLTSYHYQDNSVSSN